MPKTPAPTPATRAPLTSAKHSDVAVTAKIAVHIQNSKTRDVRKSSFDAEKYVIDKPATVTQSKAPRQGVTDERRNNDDRVMPSTNDTARAWSNNTVPGSSTQLGDERKKRDSARNHAAARTSDEPSANSAADVRHSKTLSASPKSGLIDASGSEKVKLRKKSKTDKSRPSSVQPSPNAAIIRDEKPGVAYRMKKSVSLGGKIDKAKSKSRDIVSTISLITTDFGLGNEKKRPKLKKAAADDIQWAKPYDYNDADDSVSTTSRQAAASEQNNNRDEVNSNQNIPKYNSSLSSIDKASREHDSISGPKKKKKSKKDKQDGAIGASVISDRLIADFMNSPVTSPPSPGLRHQTLDVSLFSISRRYYFLYDAAAPYS